MNKHYNARLDEALKNVPDVQRVEILSIILLEVFNCLGAEDTSFDYLKDSLKENGLPDSTADMTIILSYLCDTIGCMDVLNENLEDILKKLVKH